MKRIFLKPNRDRSVRKHHPWIFSGAIDERRTDCAGRNGEDVTPPFVGETVEVVSAEGETLGYGSYSPASQIRVRMLTFAPGGAVSKGGAAGCRTYGECRIPDGAFVEGLVAASVARRSDFFSAASTTNACRVVNAENDGLPGVVADAYDGWVVCQFTSAGAEFWKKTIAAALMKSVPGCKGVAERTDLKDREKEGLSGEGRGQGSRSPKEGEGQRSEIRGQTMEGLNSTVQPSTSNLQPSFRILAGAEPPKLIEIFEGSIRFLVDVRKGHKTGFYLDQRDARATVGVLAKGRTVLNCFSYTGGFGLAAAAGGATHVTQVDVSRDALALARRNEGLTAAVNQTVKQSNNQTIFSYVEADVFQYLRQCRDARKTFDLIVLDPPKFAETKAQVIKAARGYKDINLLAMKLLNPGGILATFSCSGAMTAELFDTILAEASQDAGRDFQTIARTRQGADHPVALNFPEGLYLKGVILRSLK